MSAHDHFRITVDIPVPADIFENAATMTKLKPVIEKFKTDLPRNATFDARLVHGRDEAPPRKRKGAATPETPEQSAEPLQEAAE